MKFKKTISIILAVSMLFCSSSLSVFAGATKSLNVVTFGDSMTNGYGTSEFWAGETTTPDGLYDRGQGTGGFDHCATFAYPQAIITHLKDQGYKASVSRFNFEGTSFDAVHAMLSKDLKYYNDCMKVVYEGETYKNYKNDELASHVLSWTNGKEARWTENKKAKTYNSIKELRSDAQTRVKKADLVILDNFNSNYGVYMSSRLMTVLGYVGGETGFRQEEFEKSGYANRLEDLSKYTGVKLIVKAVRPQIYKMVRETVGDSLPTDLILELVDTLVYTFVEGVWAANQSVQDVKALNPNAKIVLVGPQNLFQDINLTVSGVTVPLGDYLGILFGGIGTYLKYLGANAGDYYYVDCAGSPEEIVAFMDKWHKYDKTINNEENIDEYCQLLVTFSSLNTKYPDDSMQTVYGKDYAKPADMKAAVQEEFKKLYLTKFLNWYADYEDDDTSAEQKIALLSYDDKALYDKVKEMAADKLCDLVVSNIIKCTGDGNFDLTPVLRGLSGLWSEMNNILKTVVKEDEISASEKLFAQLYLTFIIQQATGCHPSDEGVVVKGNLVLDGVDKALGLHADPSNNLTDKAKADAVKAAIKGIKNIVMKKTVTDEDKLAVDKMYKELKTFTFAAVTDSEIQKLVLELGNDLKSGLDVGALVDINKKLIAIEKQYAKDKDVYAQITNTVDSINTLINGETPKAKLGALKTLLSKIDFSKLFKFKWSFN
ncbi:MAG: hypothetical protein MJ146_01295 [Clostridia bacterium]|nr:hypothetical protein [Clostridia bacterium]